MWTIVSLMCIAGLSLSQSANVNYCQNTINCHDIAQPQRQICDNLQPVTVKNETEMSNCRKEIYNWKKEQSDLKLVRNRQFRNCLNNLTLLSKPRVGKPNKCGNKNYTLEIKTFSNFKISANKSISPEKQQRNLETAKHRACVKHLKAVDSQCNALRNCCDLSNICDEIYMINEVADTHKKIHQLSLKILLAERECPNPNKKRVEHPV